MRKDTVPPNLNKNAQAKVKGFAGTPANTGHLSGPRPGQCTLGLSQTLRYYSSGPQSPKMTQKCILTGPFPNLVSYLREEREKDDFLHTRAFSENSASKNCFPMGCSSPVCLWSGGFQSKRAQNRCLWISLHSSTQFPSFHFSCRSSKIHLVVSLKM